MQTVTGKAIREGAQYKDIKELVLDVRNRFANMDAFVFRRQPDEAWEGYAARRAALAFVSQYIPRRTGQRTGE